MCSHKPYLQCALPPSLPQGHKSVQDASSLPQTVRDEGQVSEACMRWKRHGSLHMYEDNSPGFNLQLGFNRLSKEEVCGCHGNSKLPRTRLVSKEGGVCRAKKPLPPW